MKMTRTITFTINGKARKEPVETNTLLVNLIRERLTLTGTKYACGIGECGACTVLINGKPALSCLTLAAEADGKDIVTIEGLNDKISTVLRETFLEEGAVQCGFCTPGFLVMSSYLLKEKPKPTEDEVKKYIKGNLCRCTGYIGVIRAIMKASEKINN
jgi:carbon-monoxide dehydrogenase small subunit